MFLFLPDRWRKHSLELGHSSVYGDQELHVVKGHCGGHGVRVVFVIYAQVSTRRLTPPVHCQVQRCGLNALGRHLTQRIGERRREFQLSIKPNQRP